MKALSHFAALNSLQTRITSSANALDFIINGLLFNDITLVYHIANKYKKQETCQEFRTDRRVKN